MSKKSEKLSSNQEIMDYLSREFDDAVEYASVNGLSVEEIVLCMKSAFQVQPKDQHSPSVFSKKCGNGSILREICENSNFGDNSNSKTSVNHLQSQNFSFISSLLVTLFKVFVVTTLILALLLCVASHNPTQKFVTRHLQVYVYPVMRHLRLLTLPFLSKYKFFTQIHEEECLLKNPLYSEPPVDCWSCEEVRTVVDLTGHANLTTAYQDCGVPFITQSGNETKSGKITFSSLRKAYQTNISALERGTSSLSSDDGTISYLNQLFSLDDLPAESHITWKINRVCAVQVIRKIFHRPYFVPINVEVALQRFIYIDGAKFSTYELPITEFANVWIAQGSGYRQVTLVPSNSCKKRCHTISILMKPGDILYYNWQFHRAKTYATKINNEVSVTLMGSFY